MERNVLAVTTIADRLREALRARGMTVYWLAERSGVSESYLSRLLSGQRGDRVSGDKIAAIGRALGVRAEWLLDGDGAMETAATVRQLRDRQEWPDVRRLTLEQHPELDSVFVDAVGNIADDPTVMPEKIDLPFVHGFAAALRDASARARAKR
jgi:transcriptional regulator with XRE-family HTH domain